MIESDDKSWFEKRYKTLNIISSIILVIAAVAIVVFFWLVFFQGKPPIEIAQPLPVDKEQYYPGDVMIMEADLCRYVAAPAEIYPAFFTIDDSYFYPLPPIQSNLGEGCLQTKIISSIPHDLPPGIYYRKSNATYHVNELVDRSAEWRTESFEVLPPKE